MQLVDRIEKRRFVGREFLLWLWFESEVFEGTLATEAHGPFGLWLEARLSLSAGDETTRIKGGYPARPREAKEALLSGKLPDLAGVRVARGAHETSFTLRAETMALAGLAVPAVLGKRGRGEPAGEDDEAHEAFYERMRLTRETEEILEALYKDFLALRLGPRWSAAVVPAMRAWAAGETVDADAYRAAREGQGATGAGRRRPTKKRTAPIPTNATTPPRS